MRPTRALTTLTWMLTAGALAGGCASPEQATALQHEATMTRVTRGLVLHETGERGHAGMFGTNCPFETRFGRVTGDYQLPDEDEEVQDGGPSSLGDETVLLVQPHRNVVHLLEKSTGDYEHERVRWYGVISGRLTLDGLVGLAEDDDGGCSIQWLEDEAVVSSVEAPHCDAGAFDASPGGTVLLGLDDGAVLVRPDELPVQVEADGRLVVFDPAMDHWYVAREGADEVVAIDNSGARLWSTVVDGPVVALGHAGARGAAVVSHELGEGGGVTYLDGRTGDELGQVGTPSAAPKVTHSGDGSTLALVLDEEAHFYSVGID
jgi:hypothetical protein